MYGELIDCIEHIEVVDLPLTGGNWTWFNEELIPLFLDFDRFLVFANVLPKLLGLT